MAADSVTVSPTYNGDSVSLTAGMIVRLAGANNNVVRAQADTAPHVQGVNGVVISGASAPGSAVLCACVGRETVQMESGLTLSVGDTVYVSPNVAGKGTNVLPAEVSAIGTVADTTNYTRLGTVEVDVVVSVGGGSGGGAAGTVKSVTGPTGSVNNSDPTNPVIQLATPSNPGVIPAASEAKIEGIASAGWFDAQVLAMQAAAPTLSAFDYIKLGQFPNTVSGFTSNLIDTDVAGGSIAVKGTSVWVAFSARVVPLPKSTVWAVAVRMTITLPGAGIFAAFGIAKDTPTTSAYGFNTNQAVDATHIILAGGTNVVTPFVADTAFHDFVIVHTIGALSLLIDGAVVQTMSDVAMTDTDPMQIAVYCNSGTTATNIQKMAYGYVQV